MVVLQEWHFDGAIPAFSDLQNLEATRLSRNQSAKLLAQYRSLGLPDAGLLCGCAEEYEWGGEVVGRRPDLIAAAQR